MTDAGATPPRLGPKSWRLFAALILIFFAGMTAALTWLGDPANPLQAQALTACMTALFWLSVAVIGGTAAAEAALAWWAGKP